MGVYAQHVVEPPDIDWLDIAAFASALSVLVIAYLVYPNRIVQYGAWLVVFTIWMAWFVYYGTKWLYGVRA